MVEKGDIEFLTDDHIVSMLGFCKYKRDYLLVRLLWRTGARVSEILLLRPKDVDFDFSTINVPTNKRRVDPYSLPRTIKLDGLTIDVLKKFIEEERIAEDKPVFRITRFAVFGIIRCLGHKVGITKVANKSIHPHHFRHAFARRMIKSGRIAEMRDVLGHASFGGIGYYIPEPNLESRRKMFDDIFRDIDNIGD